MPIGQGREGAFVLPAKILLESDEKLNDRTPGTQAVCSFSTDDYPSVQFLSSNESFIVDGEKGNHGGKRLHAFNQRETDQGESSSEKIDDAFN